MSAGGKLLKEAFPFIDIGEESAHACDVFGGKGGRSFVFVRRTGRWEDLATGDKGKGYRALFARRGDADKYSAQIDAAEAELEANSSERPRKVVPIRPGTVIVGDTEMPKVIKHHQFGIAAPENVFPYMTLTGTYRGACVRFTNKEGGKEIRYLVAADSENSSTKWSWKGFGERTPLYNLPELKDPKKADWQVLVVEGEKTAEACRGVEGVAVTTWPGGSKNERAATWNEIRDRDVILLPDYDEPGVAAMEIICNVLRNLGCRVRVLPADAVAAALGTVSPKRGWDVADAERLPEVIISAILAEAAKVEDELGAPDFYLTEDNRVKPSPANTLIALEAMAEELQLVFNDDIKSPGYRTPPPWREEVAGEYKHPFDQMQDEDSIRITHLLRERYEVDFPRAAVVDSLYAVALANSFSPWRDYLNGLKWDGDPRLETLFDQLGCQMFSDDDKTEGVGACEYVGWASQYIFCGIVSRIFRPGIQMDMMPVLEGKQNIGKSKFIKTIAGLFAGADPRGYVSLDLGPLSGKGYAQKDAQMAVAGAMVVEVEELAQIERTDVNILKRFISMQIDTYRRPFGTHFKDYPRQCMLIGTTNRLDYLRDDTGNRRFLPLHLECGEKGLDFDWLNENRDNLFAEAVSLFRSAEARDTIRELLELPPELREYHKRETEDRFVEQPWVSTLRDFFAELEIDLGKERLMSPSDILTGAFDIDKQKQTTGNFKELRAALNQLGIEHTTIRMHGSRRSMYKIPPSEKFGPDAFTKAVEENLSDGSGGFSKLGGNNGLK